MLCVIGMGEKPRKNSPFCYGMEADCFSMSKSTENKPDLH